MQSVDKFYTEFDSFKDFKEIVNNAHFKAVPNEWFVIITDVKGSTKAIEAGNYKDVNTIGVAAIVAAQNAMGGLDFPFVFGGDSATLLVPPKNIEETKKALAALKELSLSRFNLELRLFEIVFAVLVFKFKVPALFFNPDKYANSLRTHSDYRKFDDMLRMIIDCTEENVAKIETYLEDLKNGEEVFYGLHRSKGALMTCYVHDIDEGNHIHFIDGSDGGYAMAAKQLKAQLKA